MRKEPRNIYWLVVFPLVLCSQKMGIRGTTPEIGVNASNN